MIYLTRLWVISWQANKTLPVALEIYSKINTLISAIIGYLHIATKFDSDFGDIYAILGKLVAFQIIIEQADRQRTLRQGVLSNNEIHNTFLYHQYILRGYIMDNDMDFFGKFACSIARHTPVRPEEVM